MIKNAGQYVHIIGSELFADLQKLLLFAIVFAFVVTVGTWIKSNLVVCSDENTDPDGKILFIGKFVVSKELLVIYRILGLLLFFSFGYFMIVVKIAPYQVDRYVFGIYPVLMLLFLCVVYQLLRYWISNTACLCVLLALVSIFSIVGIMEGHVNYLYRDKAKNIDIMKQMEGSDCLFVTDQNYKLVGNALELQHMGRVYTIGSKHLESIPEILDLKEEKLIVYIDETLNQNDILEKISERTGYKNYKKIFQSRCLAYEFEK